jgi:anaerobic selenocysteine-containing dehydrogenase
VLDIREGDRVRVESPDGAIERAVKIERGLSSGIVAVPRGFAGHDVMSLLPLKDFADPDFPGLITCSAKITKV